MRDRPLLIFDGQCRFCRYCVDYAVAATGERVEYRPFQEVLQAFPDIAEEEFRASIQLVMPDGERYSGAGAAFKALYLGGKARLWYRCYAFLPLFAVISEWVYRSVARHRAGCYRLCRWLFGAELRPARVDRVTALFLRLLGLIYLAAFASFTWQAPGLVGEAGILPAGSYLEAVAAANPGLLKFWMIPALFWLDASDAALQGAGFAGCVLSLALLLGWRQRLCLPVLYLLYLSLYYAGQVFMSFQWDILLLECGFLAIFLPWSPRLICWLYRWLLLRFMLQAGLVKLMSGDPSWHNLTALQYHFETQPLPTALAWYAHHLPPALLQSGVLFTFAVELFVPFLMLMPRRPRMLAAAITALFQLMILATGSYNFFNLLTLALCLLLLDDQALDRLWRRGSGGGETAVLSTGVARRRVTARGMTALVWSVALIYLVQSWIILDHTGFRKPLAEPLRQLLAWSAPFHIANNYGVFAVMTTKRHEVIIEGSRDGREWLPYTLPFNAGDPQRAPRWAAPHQPRLDWQLWFAALAPREGSPWLRGLMAGLLQGSPAVTGLFEHDPFAGDSPAYIRASLYRYHFSEAQVRRDSGAWWRRQYVGEFWPVSAWRLPVEKLEAEKNGVNGENTDDDASERETRESPPSPADQETLEDELRRQLQERIRPQLAPLALSQTGQPEKQGDCITPEASPTRSSQAGLPRAAWRLTAANAPPAAMWPGAVTRATH